MIKKFFLFAIVMLSYAGVYAQTSNDKNNFLGSWDIVMLALPQGDTKSQLMLTEADGKLTGVLKFGEPAAEVAIVNPEIKNSVLTFRATLQGYDIDFVLERNMEGLLKGSMYNNMFVVTGKKSDAAPVGK